MTNRIEWLDAVKGIGILLVMMSHLCVLPHPLIDGYIPLFFLAAGLTYKPRPFHKDVKGKAKRLLIPYLFYSFVILFSDMLFSLVRGTFDAHQFLTAIFGVVYSRINIDYPYSPDSIKLLGSNAPMWFLPCMFIAYLYTSWYSNSHHKKTILTIAIISLFAMQDIPYQLPWSIDISVMSFLFVACSNRYKYLIFNFLYTPPLLSSCKQIKIG